MKKCLLGNQTIVAPASANIHETSLKMYNNDD